MLAGAESFATLRGVGVTCAMAQVLLGALPADRAAGADVAALEGALRGMWGRARETWPGLVVGQVSWVTAIAERLASAGPLVEALDRIEADDLYLVLGCGSGAVAALRAFDTQLESLRPALRRAGADATTIDDVLAQLRARLLVAAEGTPPKVLQYQARAKLGSWLRVAAMRDYGALAKKRQPEDDAELEALLVSTADPELEELRQRFRTEFRVAFSVALAALDDKDRAVLRLHLVDRLSIDRIGALYDVHRSTAARWLVDIRDRLYAETRDQFRARLGLAPAEFDSMMALVLSQLTYSVGRDLEEGRGPCGTQ